MNPKNFIRGQSSPC